MITKSQSYFDYHSRMVCKQIFSPNSLTSRELCQSKAPENLSMHHAPLIL